MTDAAIDVRSVSVSLGDTRVLDDVDLSIEAGRFVGVVGPNGAGKTTLLRTINGRIDPDWGRVSVVGEPVGDLSSKAVGRLVATVPQRTELSFALPVRDIVEMGRFPHRSRLRLVDPGADRVEWAMERTAVAQLADRPVTDTSGGERQRVLLARALAQQTPVLLLDEPTASLDVNHQVRTLALARELVDDDGRTVVAAIHDLDLAARFCDELLLLADGRVMATGRPETVLEARTLEAAFGAPVGIGTNPVTGTPTVTALPWRDQDPGTSRGRVHVIGGGGRAAPLLHRLVAAGYSVSIGVIAEDDPDAVAAGALDLETVTVPPFSPVDPAVAAAIERVEAADVTVLADVDVGSSNAANLRVAGTADDLVVVDDRPFDVRNHAGESAARRYASLVEGARVTSEAGVVAAVAAATSADKAVAADGGP